MVSKYIYISMKASLKHVEEEEEEESLMWLERSEPGDGAWADKSKPSAPNTSAV